MTDTLPNKVVIYRKATHLDAINIFKVIRHTFEDSKLNYPPVEEGPTITWIVDTINTGLVYLAEVSGRVVGSIGLQSAEFPWVHKDNPRRWYYANLWFYVNPSFRKYGIAEALIKKSQALVREINAILSIGIHIERDAELKERFLQIQGMTYVGGNFIYQDHLFPPEVSATTKEVDNGKSKSVRKTKKQRSK